MDVLFYNDFNYYQLKDKITKTLEFLKAGDFRAADVKKMPNQGYYRAKLDDTNRLLFRIGTYQDKSYIFILEVILNHNYSRCRFLNGVGIDENKLIPVHTKQDIEGEEVVISYLNTGKKIFHVLDKELSFDDAQVDIVHLPAPLIVIGPAGSGKTALMLEKVKTLQGNILYISLSPYLVENAQNLYASHGYDNPRQTVEFLSFNDYLDSIEVGKGKEVHYQVFQEWASRYSQSYKIRDTHKLYEEFKGVLTGSVTDKPYLSAEDYQSLGVRQSIFQQQEREAVYQLFSKFLTWLEESGYYDSNVRSFNLLQKVDSRYDYVLIDEVQDITNIQLYAILKSLNESSNFLLCGDSNQIVHPNFFSWSQVKSLFYQQELTTQIIQVLATNYRNTAEVTAVANRLLLIKNARFGSIDKESTYLVKANSTHQGIVEFLPNNPRVNTDLNNKTRKSAKFAVLVLRDEDKAEARKYFQTPLLFSIHEAKGLEYESIILFNMVSGHDKSFREITEGVTEADLESTDIHFSRAKDKTDRSLDVYKFYINALYVGMTRAIKNLFFVESNNKHDLLRLLGLVNIKQQTTLKDQASSQEEWKEEARKLELQGKQEQADAIRQNILHIRAVEWEVITPEYYSRLLKEALDPEQFNKKAKDRLFHYSVFYQLKEPLYQLSLLKYRPAERWEDEEKVLMKRLFQPYITDNLKGVLPVFEKYGIDFRYEFNVTPLFMAFKFKAISIADFLLNQGVKTDTTDHHGHNALQWVMKQSRSNASAKELLMNRYYQLLKGAPLRIKIGSKMLKLESHQAEYMLINYMIATLSEQLVAGSSINAALWKRGQSPSFQTQDFLEFYEGLGEQVLPEYRTRRPYISSILSKNELSKDDKYNKKLFMRLQQGHYVPHPAMELLVGEKWENIYDLINLKEIQKNAMRSTSQTFFREIQNFDRNI